MRTSAKARLTSVAIRLRIRIRDPDRHQNLIISSIGSSRTFPDNFIQIRLDVFAQSSWQTHKQTNKQRRKHNLFGGGNKHTKVVK